MMDFVIIVAAILVAMTIWTVLAFKLMLSKKFMVWCTKKTTKIIENVYGELEDLDE